MTHLSPLEEARICREIVEAHIPWWWRRARRRRVMADVEAYARARVAVEQAVQLPQSGAEVGRQVAEHLERQP